MNDISDKNEIGDEETGTNYDDVFEFVEEDEIKDNITLSDNKVNNNDDGINGLKDNTCLENTVNDKSNIDLKEINNELSNDNQEILTTTNFNIDNLADHNLANKEQMHIDEGVSSKNDDKDKAVLNFVILF